MSEVKCVHFAIQILNYFDLRGCNDLGRFGETPFLHRNILLKKSNINSVATQQGFSDVFELYQSYPYQVHGVDALTVFKKGVQFLCEAVNESFEKIFNTKTISVGDVFTLEHNLLGRLVFKVLYLD